MLPYLEFIKLQLDYEIAMIPHSIPPNISLLYLTLSRKKRLYSKSLPIIGDYEKRRVNTCLFSQLESLNFDFYNSQKRNNRIQECYLLLNIHYLETFLIH